MNKRIFNQSGCFFLAVFVFVHVGLAVLGTDCLAQQKATEIASVNDVIAKWTADQHLYIKGELGIGVQQQILLEEWLDKNAPHWTIVLMRNASGESYLADDARRFEGMDAVEFALGHGLANKTKFGLLEHPKSGETDGCVFVLFLQERQLSYFGSDAQDRRGIGESAWIGNLDGDAIRAMRDGGRILDAVKNTVMKINSRLEQELANEERAEKQKQEQERRAALERERLVLKSKTRMDDMENNLLPLVPRAVEKFKASFPKAAESEMAKTSIQKWKSGLSDLRSALNESNVREISQKLEQLEGDVHRTLNAFADHQDFAQSLQPLEQRWDTLTFRTGMKEAEPFSVESKRFLDQAKNEHERGIANFSTSLNKAKQIIEDGESAVLKAVTQKEQEDEKRRMTRRLLMGVAGGLSLVVVGILTILNWLRRPSLRRAFSEFSKRNDAAERESAAFEQTLSKRNALPGISSESARKNYQGTTAELLREIDSKILLLSNVRSEIQNVTDAAKSLLHPGTILGEISNMVSSSRYLACINLLSGKSLNGAIANIRPSESGAQWVTYDQFVDAFRIHLSELKSKLDRIAHGLENNAAQTNFLRDQHKSLVSQSQIVNGEALSTKFFPIPSLSTSLIPSIESIVAQSSSLALSDPVRNIESNIPVGIQQTEDGLAIVAIIANAVKNVFPRLDLAADILRKQSQRTDWIPNQVFALGKQADALIVQACQGSVAAQVKKLNDDLLELGERAEQCAKLASELDNRSESLVSKLQTSLSESRAEVVRALSIPEKDSISEQGYNPDNYLASARKQLTAASAALDLGQIAVASNAMATAERDVERGLEIVADSLATLKNFPKQKDHTLQVFKETEKQSPDVQTRISSCNRRFATSALALQAGEFAAELTADLQKSGSSIQSLNEIASNLIKGSDEAIRNAEKAFRVGKVLEAANLLQLSEGDLMQAQAMFLAIRRHCDRLDELVTENKQLVESLTQALLPLDGPIQDIRSQVATINEFDRTRKSLTELRSQLLSERLAGVDPILENSRLNEIETGITKIRGMLEADQKGHAQAVLAIKGAGESMAACQSLVEKAAFDQIPDSETITQCHSALEKQKGDFARVVQASKVAHGDWKSIQAAAAELNAELGITAGKLARELGLAEQAATSFQNASKAVYNASQWVGSFGVIIYGTPGSDEMERAREELTRGNYKKTIELSNDALAIANRAIAAAESEVDRMRQQRQNDLERRRRATASSIFSGGSSFGSSSHSSFGGGRSSSSRSSGGSSSGGSSFRGGGSGFSRSGW